MILYIEPYLQEKGQSNQMILPNGNSSLKHATICSILSLLLYSHYMHYNVCTQSDPSPVQLQEPHPTGYSPYWTLLHVIQTLEPGTVHKKPPLQKQVFWVSTMYQQALGLASFIINLN